MACNSFSSCLLLGFTWRDWQMYANVTGFTLDADSPRIQATWGFLFFFPWEFQRQFFLWDLNWDKISMDLCSFSLSKLRLDFNSVMIPCFPKWTEVYKGCWNTGIRLYRFMPVSVLTWAFPSRININIEKHPLRHEDSPTNHSPWSIGVPLFQMEANLKMTWSISFNDTRD